MVVRCVEDRVAGMVGIHSGLTSRRIVNYDGGWSLSRLFRGYVMTKQWHVLIVHRIYVIVAGSARFHSTPAPWICNSSIFVVSAHVKGLDTPAWFMLVKRPKSAPFDYVRNIPPGSLLTFRIVSWNLLFCSFYFFFVIYRTTILSTDRNELNWHEWE